jgi:signal transduction histidine kinase
VLGVSSIYVAGLDFIHTLIFPGMILIEGSDTNIASQFWIAARFLQVFSILGGLWTINKKIKEKLLMAIYTLITVALSIMIFTGFFPDTFIEGTGLTLFKIISEYLIIVIILISIILIYRIRKEFQKSIYYLINAFLITLIISEFTFTLYLSAYELPNLIGHILKIIAFYFLYKAIIQIGLRNPVQLLFKKLNDSKNKFEEAYNRADFLMDLIAHDINNILQVILLRINSCQRFIDSPEKTKELEESFKSIEQQVINGSKLISNIIKFSRLEDEDITLEKFEINSLLEQKIAQIKELYQHRDLSIQITSPENHIYAYANDLLGEVYENLLFNAIKHNKDMPLEILIRLTRERIKNKAYIKMEFIDNGKGIEDSRKETLFQGDFSFKRSVGGMGLGLSLVKKIIELFKGKIWVEDRVKGNHTKGCNFIILLPEA